MPGPDAKFRLDVPSSIPNFRVEPRYTKGIPPRYLLLGVGALSLFALKIQRDQINHRKDLLQDKLRERFDLSGYVVAEEDKRWLEGVGLEAAERHYYIQNPKI